MLIKERIKGFIVGVIITALLSVTVFAAPIEQTVKIAYNNIKLYVDGTLIQPKDANGNAIEPFIYNGTTYLPVRAVGQAFGKAVKWDGKTNSVYIGKVDDTTPSAWLESLDYFNFQYSKSTGMSDHYGNSWAIWNADKGKDSTGKNYSHGISYQMDVYSRRDENWQYTEYLLNQKYKMVKGTFILDYDYRNNSDYGGVLKIYGDDNLLYTSPIMKAGVLPIDFKVDLTGVIKMKVYLEIPDYNDSSNQSIVKFGLVNVGLYE